MGLFDEIRAAAREVSVRARSVHIDLEAIERLAGVLPAELASEQSEDPAHMRMASDADTLAYVLCVDAVNFGSGWFPLLRKPDGRSGYFTVATALRRHFEAEGSFSAAALRTVEAADCTRIFGQDPDDEEIEQLMELFAHSLQELGRFTCEHAGGRFEGLVALAGSSAERLVRTLAEMPLYRDVARYEDLEVPLYKRAQITAADLGLVFAGQGPGAFEDIDSLTMFPDNLVPHVLRCEGVLRYEPALLARIDAGEELEAGSLEEVEIRAVGLHAVELLVDRMRGHGVPGVSARHLDRILWGRGQSPEIKARKRHRCRTWRY